MRDPQIGPRDECRDDRKPDHQPQARQPHMDVGVARADDDAVVAVEQQIAVEAVGPGLHREQKTGQRRAVRNHRRRDRAVVSVIFDVAAHPIDRSRKQRAQDDGEQHPVLDRDIGRQREKIEADVLVVERILRAIRHLVEKLQEDAPVAGLACGDQHSEQTRTERDVPGPRQPIAHDCERIRRRTARRFPRRRLPSVAAAAGQSAPPAIRSARG